MTNYKMDTSMYHSSFKFLHKKVPQSEEVFFANLTP